MLNFTGQKYVSQLAIELELEEGMKGNGLKAQVIRFVSLCGRPKPNVWPMSILTVKHCSFHFSNV